MAAEGSVKVNPFLSGGQVLPAVAATRDQHYTPSVNRQSDTEKGTHREREREPLARCACSIVSSFNSRKLFVK